MRASASDAVDSAVEILQRVRAQRPRVHCITNTVAQTYTANLLLAAGAVPSMTLSADEVEAFVGGADALLVNVGTLDAERRIAIGLAVDAAAEREVPWVLDPVFVDRSPARAKFVRALLAMRPGVVRLNAAEFATLAEIAPADADAEALAGFAADLATTVALTGEEDVVTDGRRTAGVANGHPWMAQITAMGCAGAALVAAFRAVEPDPFRATAAALLALGVAGEWGAETSRGPGSLAIALLDALAGLDRAGLCERARVF